MSLEPTGSEFRFDKRRTDAVLTLSSGQTFEIRHPEMALLTRTSILIGTDLAEPRPSDR